MRPSFLLAMRFGCAQPNPKPCILNPKPQPLNPQPFFPLAYTQASSGVCVAGGGTRFQLHACILRTGALCCVHAHECVCVCARAFVSTLACALALKHYLEHYFTMHTNVIL